MSMKKNSYMLNGNITSLARHGVDRKCEDYSSTSPYAYCAANPIRYIDPTGMNPVYDRNGIYLGDTSEGFTGEVLVMRDGYASEIDVSKMTADDLLWPFKALKHKIFKYNLNETNEEK